MPYKKTSTFAQTSVKEDTLSRRGTSVARDNRLATSVQTHFFDSGSAAAAGGQERAGHTLFVRLATGGTVEDFESNGCARRARKLCGAGARTAGAPPSASTTERGAHARNAGAPPSCYDTSLSIQTRPLLPLRFRSTRVHATQASVCWRAQSTVDSLFFIDVPTNPGPRSFCARPVRRYCWRRS